jgi:uncharacterized protein YegL
MAALFCFQRYSLWFSSPQTAQSVENWLSLVDKNECDQILKKSFDRMQKEEREETHLTPVHESVAPIAPIAKAPKEGVEEKKSIFFQLNFPLEETLLTNSFVLPTFSMPNQSFNLLEHLPKDLIIPSQIKLKPPRPILPIPTTPSVEVSAKAPNFHDSPRNLIVFSNAIELGLSDEMQKGKSTSPIPLPNLPKLPSLEELETSSYSESFDADLVFLPKEEEKGYLFALTLIPRPDLNLPPLTQAITFLIDRSNSIQQSRLAAAKAAVHKALSELSSQNTFNIIAFDAKMDKMSPNYLPCTGKSYAVAEAFLEKVQLGSFFASPDLYKPLFLTVPNQVGQGEIHTAILITDGESLHKKTMQEALFSHWTHYNAGRVTLFALGMNDAQAPKLDAITLLNRGKSIHSATNRGMKRKLLKLLKTIQNPIAKNISCHAMSKSPNGKIVLYPKASQLPHLYLDQPYVILGEVETLDDFILFIQGRLKSSWLNIRKTISFLNARKASSTLKEEWALQKALILYEKYVEDADPKYLVEAEKLLQPLKLPVAF